MYSEYISFCKPAEHNCFTKLIFIKGSLCPPLIDIRLASLGIGLYKDTSSNKRFYLDAIVRQKIFVSLCPEPSQNNLYIILKKFI